MEETHLSDKGAVGSVARAQRNSPEVGRKAFCFDGNVAVNILRSPKIKIFSYVHVVYFEAS